MKNVLRERIYSNALDYFRYVYVFSMLCNLACGRERFDSVVGDVFFVNTCAIAVDKLLLLLRNKGWW